MDRLAHVLGAPECKGEVRDPTRHAGARTPLLDARRCLDERLPELRVLLDAGADGEDVRVEDDVLRHKAGLLGQQRVRALADLDLPLDGLGLASLVERHHERGCPEPAHAPSLVEERLLPLLQAQRVRDTLPLNALEACLEHGEA